MTLLSDTLKLVAGLFAYADVDECEDGSRGGCHDLRECTNLVGGMRCEDCPAGWTNDGAKGCTGERLDGELVTLLSDTLKLVAGLFVYADVDECEDGSRGGCHDLRECTNLVGGMRCEDCPAGWTNDGAKGCTGERLDGELGMES